MGISPRTTAFATSESRRSVLSRQARSPQLSQNAAAAGTIVGVGSVAPGLRAPFEAGGMRCRAGARGLQCNARRRRQIVLAEERRRWENKRHSSPSVVRQGAAMRIRYSLILVVLLLCAADRPQLASAQSKAD